MWNNLNDHRKVKIIVGIIAPIALALIQIFRDYL